MADVPVHLAEYLKSNRSSLSDGAREEIESILASRLRSARSSLPQKVKHWLDDPEDIERLRRAQLLIYDLK